MTKREEKKQLEATAPSKPKKVNTSALKKKLHAQLEGLDLLESLIQPLIRSGLGTIDSKTLKHLNSQIKELGKGKAPTTDEMDDAANAVGGEEADDSNEPAGDNQDDDASEVGDGDAAAEKRQRQKAEYSTYDTDDSDDSDAGEPDDEALEVEYASDASVRSDERAIKKTKTDSKLKAAVSRAEQGFLQHFPAAVSFKYTPTEATIQLQVRRLIAELCDLATHHLV